MSAARDGSIGWNEIEGDLGAALREVHDLRTQLAAQRARASDLQAALDLRNAALDAAKSVAARNSHYVFQSIAAAPAKTQP
jgi:hypothetical protein